MIILNDKTIIKSKNIVADGKCISAALLLEGGIIKDILHTDALDSFDARIADAADMYVMPGFVELHAHGGGGCDFMDASEEAFKTITDTHLMHGTTSIAPSTVACSFEAMEKLFKLYRHASGKTDINLLGLHLEGPYISMEMRGAQNPFYVRAPSKYEIDRLTDEAGDIIAMCTAAPELSGIRYMARKMRDRSITLSIGHSNGTCADAKAAEDMGFTHMTHLYSNTPGVRKINQVVCAGMLEAAYFYDFDIELIGDGHHVAKEVLKLALKIKGANKINLTTDAMRAAGTDTAESYLGEVKPENRVIIEDGVAKLPDRSYFAGSTATGDVMLKWAVNICGIDIAEASKMLSETPSRIIGAKNKGKIARGADADIIIADKNLDIKSVYVMGKNIFERTV